MSRVHDVCKPRVECVEPAAAAERERGMGGRGMGVRGG